VIKSNAATTIYESLQPETDEIALPVLICCYDRLQNVSLCLRLHMVATLILAWIFAWS